MSKTAKQSIFILIFLLIVCLGAAFFSFTEKEKAAQQVLQLTEKLKQAHQDVEKSQEKVKAMEQDLDKLSREKASIEKDYLIANGKIKELSSKSGATEEERADWDKQIAALRKERDALAEKVAHPPEPKIIYKEAEPKIVEKIVEVEKPVVLEMPTGDSGDDQYWAGIIKERAELEVQIKNLKNDLAKSQVEISDLKQKNVGFQLKIDSFETDKINVQQEIQHRTDMVNNLSLQLAQARNDRKFSNDRLKKLEMENNSVKEQLKNLIATKSQLEKTLIKLNEEKQNLSNQLVGSESVIQSKIDEIWEIKDSIDQTFKSTQVSAPSDHGKGIELPAIIVSSDGPHFTTENAKIGFNGHVLSINETNNFIVTDLGESSGVKAGDSLNVYRGSDVVAQVEVIQVRKDIAAADIKQQWSHIKVGDEVK